MNKFLLIYFGLIFSIVAQDNLLDLIDDGPLEKYPVSATFKATRIVNAQSIELARPKTLEFMIQHRFGSLKNGFYDLFGMDEATIRFELKYGLNQRLSFGIGRSSLNKTIDLFTKVKIVTQSNLMPISFAVYTKVEVETLERQSEYSDQFENRLTYDSQFLIARKMNSSVSIQLMPTIIHHNWVEVHADKYDLYSLGLGGRFKLTKRVALNGDTFFPIGDRGSAFVQSWGLGCDIETGGHVFQLMITNVQGAFESAYIENASGKIKDMNLYLGFNITRVFSL